MEEDISDRLHVELGEELAERLRKCVPKGLRSTIVRNVLEALVDHVEENGQGIIVALLGNKMDIRDIVQNMNPREQSHDTLHPKR